MFLRFGRDHMEPLREVIGNPRREAADARAREAAVRAQEKHKEKARRAVQEQKAAECEARRPVCTGCGAKSTDERWEKAGEGLGYPRGLPPAALRRLRAAGTGRRTAGTGRQRAPGTGPGRARAEDRPLVLAPHLTRASLPPTAWARDGRPPPAATASTSTTPCSGSKSSSGLNASKGSRRPTVYSCPSRERSDFNLDGPQRLVESNISWRIV